MDLSTFFQKFDQFADAPDAVAKMRELVMELAVRGQLSERQPKDQNDSAWQAFLNEFDNRIYGSDPGPPPPFAVPNEWRWGCLEDVGTTKVRNDVEDRMRVSFVPMALISSTYGVAAQTEERTWSEIKKGFTHFAEGDVVMAKITPCFENAKSAVMRNLINGVGAGTTELHVFRKTKEVILPEFVLLYIKTRGFITRGESRMTGSAGQKRVPREYFATSPFPLPPLPEQKRIVAKVDELMALCDRLEAQQQERETRHAALARASLSRFADAPTSANLEWIFHPSYPIPPADLRKAILTLAVQGKLVPQDPNDEDANELLKQVVSENSKLIKNGASSKKKPLTELTDKEITYDAPDGWVWSRMGDLAHYQKGYAFKSEDYLERGLMITKIKNLTDNHTENSVYITPERAAEFDQYLLRENDIVMTTVGSWFSSPISAVGRSFAVNAIFDNSLLNQNAVRIRFLRGLVPMYFFICINSPTFKSYLVQEAQGTANQASITQESIKNFGVCVPPLAEQHRIVAKVDQLMALVDALETHLAASRATAAKLLAALVAELTAPRPEPEVEVIHLHSTPEFRAQLAAEIVDRQHAHPTFGQTKLQKVIYLAEYLFQLSEIDSRPRRFPRGPHDPELMDQVEHAMRDHEWFAIELRTDGHGYRYRSLERAGAHRDFFTRLWPDKAPRIRSLIDEMFTWNTERCERFATVYAAWNDLLIWGETVTDATILREVLERWHPDKLNIPKSSWLETLQWMREHNYIPTGFGRATHTSPLEELKFT